MPRPCEPLGKPVPDFPPLGYPSGKSLRRQGAIDAALLAAYPTIHAEDLANAWAYARAHRDEMDREIAANGDES